MGQAFERVDEQVKQAFLESNGEPYYEGNVFCYNSLFETSRRFIGELAIDLKTELLRQVLEEGLGNNPEIAVWASEEETATKIIDMLLTKISESRLIESDQEVASENTRRYDAFTVADNARYATVPLRGS